MIVQYIKIHKVRVCIKEPSQYYILHALHVLNLLPQIEQCYYFIVTFHKQNTTTDIHDHLVMVYFMDKRDLTDGTNYRHKTLSYKKKF
jgi:hypothetical protein